MIFDKFSETVLRVVKVTQHSGSARCALHTFIHIRTTNSFTASINYAVNNFLTKIKPFPYNLFMYDTSFLMPTCTP